MKSYLEENSIRLVGKAWEIRQGLRKLGKPQPASVPAGAAAPLDARRSTLAAYLRDKPRTIR